MWTWSLWLSLKFIQNKRWSRHKWQLGKVFIILSKKNVNKLGKRSHTWKNAYYMSPLMWSSTLIKNVRDFPGGPVVRTPCFHCRGLRVVPGEGIKIPQAVWHNQDKWKLKIKNPQTNAGEDVERREPFCTVGGNVNWHGHYGEQYGGSLKNSYHMTLEPHSWAYIQRKTWPEKIHAPPPQCSMHQYLQWPRYGNN